MMTLEMVREYFEAGYEVVVDFLGYEDICEEWEDVVESFEEVEHDKWLYWHGFEVEEEAHRLLLFESSDD